MFSLGWLMLERELGGVAGGWVVELGGEGGVGG